ncbi:ROK family protein [Paenibacillus albicereus]|uniref:ROK family protein n=1 Tax=Paenibacillus albicereus TaxID=2726185 RepID=A0A6H2GZL7_9BACL|nr:ROK family protein [Paenibacillus albicereus]QJC52616.1 ROK family protein [Paenibacillus albicereus]
MSASVAALDIGGTDIKYAVLDGEARIVERGSRPTPPGDCGRTVPEAAALIAAGLLERHAGIGGFGVSTAGVVDPASGEILYAGPTMAGYRGANLKAALEGRFGLPAAVLNDVNAAALGEGWRGAARGRSHYACVALGTGIGGALVTGGKLVEGAGQRAGEIGHSLYDPGSGTTYEQRASTAALLRRAAAELPGFAGGGRELFAAASSGDAACAALLGDWADDVAQGLAQVMLLFDPEAIVIGGAVSAQQEQLTGRLDSAVRRWLPPGWTPPPLAAAQLGNDAALYGAAASFYEHRSTPLQARLEPQRSEPR